MTESVIMSLLTNDFIFFTCMLGFQGRGMRLGGRGSVYFRKKMLGAFYEFLRIVKLVTLAMSAKEIT
jgi:hypothetical protein